ncbi:MAG: DUF1080 domain-containing protein [Fulvivirga sp.]
MKNLVLIFCVLMAASQPKEKEQTSEEVAWEPIWNGIDLTGWHSYLNTPYQMKEDSAGNPIEAFGIDNDPLEVVSIVETDEGNAIRISGVAWGMIYTEDSYKNYHLKLKVKWGEAMHRPRENGPRDSGLLYHGHSNIPGSELSHPWMNSQELQVQEGDMGDYWPVGEVEIDVPTVKKDSLYYQYKEGAELHTFYCAQILPTATQDSLAKRRIFKAFDAEKPHGEWNEIELITLGDSSIHIVNGEVVMRLYNSRIMNTDTPLNSGRLEIQSEGAEVFYKDLYIKSISEIPAKYSE